MSQNTEKPKTTKARIEPKIPDSVIMINQPMVRDFSPPEGMGRKMS